jgi:hypothetical protein
MYRKRQRGGNFKGKKYQRSKPKKQEGGNVVRKARRTGRKLVGKVRNSEPQIVALGRSLGLKPQPMSTAPKQMTTVQKGGSIRRNRQNGGPPNVKETLYPVLDMLCIIHNVK